MNNVIIQNKIAEENEGAMHSKIFIILNSLSILIAFISLCIFIYDRLQLDAEVGYIFQTYRPYIVAGLLMLHILMHLIEYDRIAAIARNPRLTTLIKQINRYILVGIFCIATAICTFVWGPSLPATLLIACFTATATGLLVSGRKSLIIILIIAAILLSGVDKESNIAVLQTWRNVPITYTDIILYAGIIAAIAGISWFANRQIWLMLRRALRSERELEIERNSLEVKVASRTEEIKNLQMQQMEYLSSQANVGTMAKGIFHDLMSPLTSVALYVEEIYHFDKSQNNNNQPQQANMYIQKAIAAAKKMRELLDSINKHVGEIKEIDRFDPCPEITDAILLMSYKARNKNVVLEHTGECCSDGTDNNNIRLLGNPLNFHRIILNLISNAIDASENGDVNYSKAKVTVSLELDRSANLIIVKVSDNGTGIAQENLAKIFNLDFTTKKNSSSHRHAGIGLSVVKHMVEKSFSGNIQVNSSVDSKDHGTTFTLSFPAR